MIFQSDLLLPILITLQLVFLIPSIILQIIFLHDYIKTKQRMFGLLAVLFSTHLIRIFFQLNIQLVSLEVVLAFFIFFQIFDMLALFSLILVLEMFEKNIRFSWRQILISTLVFIAIGGMISNPTLVSRTEGEITIVSFGYLSSEIILKHLFNIIAGVLLIIALYRSYKSAWSLKQKKLIKRLTFGLIFAFFLPLIPPAALIPDIDINFLIISSLIQDIFQNIGMIIIGIAFLRVSKNPWLLQRQKIHLLMVYSQSGIKLYSKVFIKGLTSDDVLLLAGGFSAVTTLFKEATKTTGQVKAILLEGKELRIINRSNFVCALLVEFTTQASELAHEKFTLEFAKQYIEELKIFNGNVYVFNSADEIVSKYFS